MMLLPDRRKKAHQWGLDAEAKAAEFLRGLNYTILAERLRTPGGEIDVLALEGKDTLVIVEVKARNNLDNGLFSITRAKQKRLARAAGAVLMQIENGQFTHKKFAGLPAASALNIRFDVIIITSDGPPYHLINAWQAD
jgi:putative endonuclease